MLDESFEKLSKKIDVDLHYLNFKANEKERKDKITSLLDAVYNVGDVELFEETANEEIKPFIQYYKTIRAEYPESENRFNHIVVDLVAREEVDLESDFFTDWVYDRLHYKDFPARGEIIKKVKQYEEESDFMIQQYYNQTPGVTLETLYESKYPKAREQAVREGFKI